MTATMGHHKRILETWAERWRSLRAWSQPQPLDVQVEVVLGGGLVDGRTHLGPRGRRITIWHDGDLVNSLGTVLHELAHVATGRYGHDDAWVQRFVAAVCEATDTPSPGEGFSADDPSVVDMFAIDLLDQWWMSSGHAFLIQMLKG